MEAAQGGLARDLMIRYNQCLLQTININDHRRCLDALITHCTVRPTTTRFGHLSGYPPAAHVTPS